MSDPQNPQATPPLPEWAKADPLKYKELIAEINKPKALRRVPAVPQTVYKPTAVELTELDPLLSQVGMSRKDFQEYLEENPQVTSRFLEEEGHPDLPAWATRARRAYMVFVADKLADKLTRYLRLSIPEREAQIEQYLVHLREGWKEDEREKERYKRGLTKTRSETESLQPTTGFLSRYYTPEQFSALDPVLRSSRETTVKWEIKDIFLNPTGVRTAKVYIPEINEDIFIPLRQTPKLTRNQLKKARRFGKFLPSDENIINREVEAWTKRLITRLSESRTATPEMRRLVQERAGRILKRERKEAAKAVEKDEA